MCKTRPCSVLYWLLSTLPALIYSISELLETSLSYQLPKFYFFERTTFFEIYCVLFAHSTTFIIPLVMLMTQETVEMFYHLRLPQTLPSVINILTLYPIPNIIPYDALPEIILFIINRYTIPPYPWTNQNLLVLLHNKLQYNKSYQRHVSGC